MNGLQYLSWSSIYPTGGWLMDVYRKKFRSQNSDNIDRWKAEMGRVRKKRRVGERRSEKRKSQKKEDAGARKGRKVAKHSVFPMICGSGGSKSRLAKAAGAEPDERDGKLHALARSTFRSQNVQNTPALDHFWKLRCRKSARCCGAKHISKSKCAKHTRSGPKLKNCSSELFLINVVGNQQRSCSRRTAPITEASPTWSLHQER